MMFSPQYSIGDVDIQITSIWNDDGKVYVLTVSLFKGISTFESYLML